MDEFVTNAEAILQQISQMKWTDYLDILLVAFLVYRILPVLRSTGTMRVARVVLVGVVLFRAESMAQAGQMLAAWVTAQLKLYTLSWLLNQILAIGLIAVVVLFQPELRRMLDHLGGLRLQNILGVERPAQAMDPVIDQTVMACEVMSREKVGALIVFARENQLDEYFKTGTVIDGQVSEQLLRNIFFPKASLHDGALIIRDGRVAAAGCVLPLSESDRLSADLGTRHRAGVGMSEVSDAVVVIVSEETGAISVAVGGMLKRHLAPQTLNRLLHNELCPNEEQKTGLVVRLRQKLLKKDKEGQK